MSKPINSVGSLPPSSAAQGMTLRDYFAGVVVAQLSVSELRKSFTEMQDARYAYLVADAMIEARNSGATPHPEAHPLAAPRLELRPPEAAASLNVGLSTFWRWAKERPGFPKARKLSPKTSIFYSDELLAWKLEQFSGKP